MENKNRLCAVTNDAANECIEKMLSADGIIMATPVYFADVTVATGDVWPHVA